MVLLLQFCVQARPPQALSCQCYELVGRAVLFHLSVHSVAATADWLRAGVQETFFLLGTMILADEGSQL